MAPIQQAVEHPTGPVASQYAERMAQREAASLSELAVRSDASSGRLHDEPDECGLRSCFQIDRDRILHSKSFRRLASKTQVFIAPEGDHYRTRLTHTLEVTGISRSVARALGLNEDLTEAIGLGHDLGHPPFGHTGEHALDQALKARFDRRFFHNEHSLRVVDLLEKDGAGLNLTNEVRDGILCHTGSELSRTLEGRIVRIVDRIAYINHDIDDALRAGLLTWPDLPTDEIALLGATGSQRIDRLVHDLVETSADAGDIVQSPQIGEAMDNVRRFMFENVYLGPANSEDKARIAELLPRLVDYFIEHPELVPEHRPDDDLPQRVTDFIAGMTDRYCLRLCQQIFMPSEWKF